MIEHKFPLDVAPSDLEPWFSPDDVAGIEPLPGWHNSIYRIDLRTGDSYVLRVHVPIEDAEFVTPSLRIAAAYTSLLPFVPAPVQTRAGDFQAILSGRVATLWPFVQGAHGESKRLTNEVAAECLARIHRAGESVRDELEEVGTERWSEKSWHDNSRWMLAANEEFILRNGPKFEVGVEASQLVEIARADCDLTTASLVQIDSKEMITVPIHGDFYPNNLLVNTEGQVAGVIDWDESRIDWRTWDLANALLEFCSGTAGTDFNVDCAKSFTSSYESTAGKLTPLERSTLPLLIRARKLDEFMYSIGETMTGAVEDWDYLNQSCKGWLQIRQLEDL